MKRERETRKNKNSLHTLHSSQCDTTVPTITRKAFLPKHYKIFKARFQWCLALIAIDLPINNIPSNGSDSVGFCTAGDSSDWAYEGPVEGGDADAATKDASGTELFRTW